MPALSGTGRLADDLYLMAHDDRSGRPHLQQRATGLGLAAALLAELLLAGTIAVTGDGIVRTGSPAPIDELSRSVLGVLAGEPGSHQLAEWLAFLARGSAVGVAARLAGSGYLVRAPARWPWRGERWFPADSDCAFAPMGRVKAALDSPQPDSAQGIVLAGLAGACGLRPRLALYLPPRSYRRLGQAVSQLDPELQDLVAQTQAAVDSAVLAHRV
ncbi:MAG TPA: GPP34 family phosphoprotein [Streptosporangiaceae bacterium]|jgi:hypothetical protein